MTNLDHEGRATAGKIVSGADAGEQPVNRADPGVARRHEATRLCEDRDQRILAQERRFARHVRAGEQADAPRFPLPTLPRLRGRVGRGKRRKVAVVGHERAAVGDERLLDHRMPSAFDDEVVRTVDLRPHIVLVDRELRERGRNVERRQRLGGLLDRSGGGGHLRRQPFEGFELDARCAIGGARDLGFELAELGAREAHLAGHRHPVDERGVQRRLPQLLGML
jgi:hypothetical protein